MNKSIYYDYQQISTYSQPLKAIVGGEGIGKTYGLKTLLLKWRSDEKREPFEVAWFIRYDVDITPQYISKWQDDLPIEFKQRIRVDGRTLYFDNEPFVYFLALSKFISGKGVPYPRVQHAVFDEFILDKDSRYLTNEIFAFKRWTQSIFRLRRVSWWLLANALSFDNPYFNYFKVKKRQESEWYSNSNIVVHFPFANVDFVKKSRESDYGRLFDDEETERYGRQAEFYFDNEEFICSQPPNAKPMFNIKSGKYVLSVWKGKNLVWVSTRAIKQALYALTPADTSTGTVHSPVLSKILKDCYTANQLWFEGLTIKNALLEEIKCL